MDPTFLKDSHVSLLSDLLALKFKQSCADFRPQNGQVKVFRFANSKLGDPRSGILGFSEFQLTDL
jgi:hypothetical protein